MTKKQTGAKLSPEKWEQLKTEREKKLAEARTQLASGVETLLKENRWKEYLEFSMKFHHYSFFNTLLIMLQRPQATHVASFHHWKSMGRYVRKGERGIDIFVPLLVGVRRKDEHPSTEKVRLHGPDGKTQEIPEKTLVGFKIGYVFDISQTDGDPLPERPYAHLQGDDAGMFAILKAAIENLLQIPVMLTTLPAGTTGCCQYDPDQDCRPFAIFLSDDPSLSGAQKLATLAHEAGHAILHSGLEYRQHSERSIRELEAESVAFCSLSAVGFNTGPMSFGYIASWSENRGGEALKAIENSAQRILEASRLILHWIDENTGIPVEFEVAPKENEMIVS